MRPAKAKSSIILTGCRCHAKLLLKTFFNRSSRMNLEAHAIQTLSARGYRITHPRRELIRVLVKADGSLTAAEAHRRARRRYPGIGLVTAYRTLELLAQEGLARRIHSECGCHGYAAIGTGHRHHVLCRRCGQVTEFEGCDLTEFLARVSRTTGFEVEEHLLELVGLCSTCRFA